MITKKDIMGVEKFLFEQLARLLSFKKIYIVNSLNYKKKIQVLSINHDYVRYRTLELIHEEITMNHIPGSVAELGVYRGNFAQKINKLFNNRPLYLFDTFMGFDPKDIQDEITQQFSSGDQDFSDTNVESVLQKMPHPELCIVKKGYFPDTAEGIDDQFSFVSIDTDLYAPIYSGLAFFYPRLSPGGAIMVHDFNNDHYPGAKQAVKEFCKKNRIPYVPIPDSGGSVIIAK